MEKIERLRRELADTLSSLHAEQVRIQEELPGFDGRYRAADEELSEVTAPAVSGERVSYNALVSKRAEGRVQLEQFERLERLTRQRDELKADEADAPAQTGGRTVVSKSVLDDFSKTVEQILTEWNYPNASRVFFDEGKRDIQIAGKERGSSGKGLRAISHAAMTIGLMI